MEVCVGAVEFSPSDGTLFGEQPRALAGGQPGSLGKSHLQQPMLPLEEVVNSPLSTDRHLLTLEGKTR